MKSIKLLLTYLILLTSTVVYAGDRLVGADLSLVPAYEKAGDQWLDEKGSVIPDLIPYLQSKGWNAVRVRVFVNPNAAYDPAVCQDLNYALALGKRVKEADMKLLIDLHYSDTWADPSTQRIPAAWTDHSTAALSAKMYDYTHSVVKALIDGDATPDYVQIGNEITYGLLWDTADGKYPTDNSAYATAGYCTTWSSRYSDGEAQWKRTASLLNNGAHAVRTAFSESGLDSTDVKIMVHTEMGGAATNSDNFYKHLRTAGFDNYDVVGLSYYPFWHGKLEVLGTLLSKLATDFPEKTVQIVETAWYNTGYPYSADASGQYTIASLNSRWTADGQGMVNYLSDLAAKLKLYDNVDGLYYWAPEECGKGFSKTVWSYSPNRGMWKNSDQQRHVMLMAADGTTPVTALARYAEDDEVQEHTDASEYFQNLGFETGDLTGWTVEQTFTTQWPAATASWMSTDVATGKYVMEMWNGKIDDGPVLSQRAQVPDGRYAITVKARANKKGFYLFAGGAKTSILAETSSMCSATTNVDNGILELGIGSKEATDNYIYFDDFTVTRIGDTNGEDDIDNTKEEEELSETQFVDEQDILYELNPEEKTAWVSDGSKASGEVVIPATITVDDNVYSVTSIGKSAFLKNEGLQAITIGRNVQSISGSAFSDCWALNTLNFEGDSQLREIAAWSFNNTGIDSLDIPVGVTVISEGAFAHCWALDFIALRGQVTSIGDFAFSDWSDADTLYANPSWMPLKRGLWIYAKQTPAISPKAFCPSDVAADTLYVHYTLVGDSIYNSLGFAAVEALDESDGSIEYTDGQGVCYKAWPDSRTATVVGFDVAHSPQNVSDWQIAIPEVILVEEEGLEKEYRVTEIADRAFYNHWRLTAATLPDGLLRIGEWAFFNTGLKRIVVPDRITAIAAGTFSRCWQLSRVEVVGDIATIGDFAFSAWAETGCGSNGGKLETVVIWSYPAPAISPKAFFAEDVAEGTLYVDKSLVGDAAYTGLGFRQVLPIDPTGIANVEVNTDASQKVYDLSGRQVTPQHRGLYIRNGRKFVK